ncbi:MAG: hypothetical protein WCO11_08975 [Sphingomonadales bacterium]|jgi:uncharacterized lipoprotein YmbA
MMLAIMIAALAGPMAAPAPVPARSPLAVAIAIHPKARIAPAAAIDQPALAAALARQLEAVGIAVAETDASQRLRVTIMLVDTAGGTPLSRMATIAAYSQILDAGGGIDPSPLATRAASCRAAAPRAADNEGRAGVQRALARCIDQLSARIADDVVRFRKTRLVN